MNERDVAWAAGLFEGEGSIIHCPYRNGMRRRLSLEMKDEDVVRRFADIVDGGNLRWSKRRNRVNRDNHHDILIWDCSRWADIERILTAFLPYLGIRRAAKARELLADPAGPIGRPKGSRDRQPRVHKSTAKGDPLWELSATS